jgi:hypothetical protein
VVGAVVDVVVVGAAVVTLDAGGRVVRGSVVVPVGAAVVDSLVVGSVVAPSSSPAQASAIRANAMIVPL